jgi:small-conductance mechanosensitive channel
VPSWWTQLFGEWNGSATALVALALGLAALAHLFLNRWVRRRSDPDSLPAGARSLRTRVRTWVPHLLKMLAPPIALVVWVHVLSLVLRVLLFQVDAGPIAQSALAWSYRAALVVCICWLLLRLGRVIDALLTSLAAGTVLGWDDLVLPIAGKAARRGLPLLALIAAQPVFAGSPALAAMIGNVTSVLLIGLISFVLYQVVDATASFVLQQHRLDTSDNLQARAVYTQVTVLKKVAVAAIAVFTVASMLMVFDSVRQFGASILASAGIAGIVVGFAAQRSIATLLAGFQIALTQPIRLDDVVIVENEWGRIEDITLTYVVVRVWDLRRLVVPITYFIEQPFQNWTRSSADLLATVFLHVDYTMPIDPLRQELTRILSASKLWDGKVNVLQVTDAKDRTLEIRALASAADASAAWDLRCEVREMLVTFVQSRFPGALPQVRGSLRVGNDHDLPEQAAAFDQPVRLRSARERQDGVDASSQ